VSVVVMDETTVVAHVARHLTSSGGRVWYNRRGLQPLPIEMHEVAIGGWYPDLLCLGRDDRVWAVEAKRGGGDLARGLGQALLYQQGAHQTFLAAPAQDLAAIRHVALAHGIGLFSVEADGIVRPTVPEIGAEPRHLHEVHRELRILSDRAGLQVRRLGSSALSLNHPLHYLVPVVLVPEGCDEPTALKSLAEQWTLKAGMASVQLAGARLLGLVRPDRQRISLTAQGRLIKAMLEDGNRDRVPWRTHWAGVTQRPTPLVDCAPIAGGILRLLYLQDPDVATLHALLSEEGKPLTLDALMLRVLRDSPNIALSLFCKREERPRLLELLQGGREEQAVSPSVLPTWLMARSRFQFKRQLIHVGLLAWEPAHSGAGTGYVASRDIWRLRDLVQ
jgi:hypothetical protein